MAMRVHRLGLPSDNLNMLSETNIEQICLIAEQEKPKLMVIDSIQVMHVADIQSSPGSMAQIRETAAYLTRFTKTRGIAIIMVGHVTKDGFLAGPKVLEHCIDCSIMLDGEADSRFRTLRSHKNRFDAVNELSVFSMTEKRLKEVSKPSAIAIARRLNFDDIIYMSYSIDFRRKVIFTMEEERLIIRETAKQFRIGSASV
ncbi:DNA repair protein RadA [Arsenophonus endosymbiont of Bemisia tabaci Q2]|nr:DNA repair protein RadA [Arsenophonus endosymbiont of Bemisia tabaci Q2]